MRHERTPVGGLGLELDARETLPPRRLAERPTFADAPPGGRDATHGLAGRILAALGERTET